MEKTADWTRGMMESLYIELRQTYPGNKLHLMLVSPFIVETGTSLQYNVLKKAVQYSLSSVAMTFQQQPTSSGAHIKSCA